MKQIVAMFFVLVTGAAYSAPVYLECRESPDSKFSVTLDEVTSKVTHTNNNGETFNAVGTFTANQVEYKLVEIGEMGKYTELVIINRSSLEFAEGVMQEFYKIDAAPIKISIDGKCRLVSVKKRKF